MRRIRFAFAAGLAALTAGTTMVVAPSAAIAQPDMTPTQANRFVMLAGASDLYEIQSSRLAVQRSRNPELRRYAQMLINHHTQTTRTVTMAARRAGVVPRPPRLNPMQQRMIAELRAARGAEFDRIYLRQQVMAHEMALALHRNYADNGDRPPLRRAAATAVPIVSRHLEEARRMSDRM